MPLPLSVQFVAGPSGLWKIERISEINGLGLPMAERLEVLEGSGTKLYDRGEWVLRGMTSNTRYPNRTEVDALVSRQAGLMRSNATRAALIPIRKTAAWWEMAQDERRAVFVPAPRHSSETPSILS